jgi:hypothetical protein
MRIGKFKIKKMTIAFFIIISFIIGLLIYSLPISDDPLHKMLAAYENQKGGVRLDESLADLEDKGKIAFLKNAAESNSFNLNEADSGYRFSYDGINVWLIYFNSAAEYAFTREINDGYNKTVCKKLFSEHAHKDGKSKGVLALIIDVEADATSEIELEKKKKIQSIFDKTKV